MYAEFGIGNHQDHERPEKDEMVDTEGLLQDPLLGKRINKGISNPGSDVLETVFRFADGHQAEALKAAPRKQKNSGNKNNGKNQSDWVS